MTKLITNPALQNMFGPLPLDVLKRLQDTLDNPRAHWAENHGIVLRDGRGFGLGLTLWQAVLAVDPTFPRRGRATDSKGKVIEDWARYPDQVLIARALKYAANAKRR